MNTILKKNYSTELFYSKLVDKFTSMTLTFVNPPTKEDINNLIDDIHSILQDNKFELSLIFVHFASENCLNFSIFKLLDCLQCSKIQVNLIQDKPYRNITLSK